MESKNNDKTRALSIFLQDVDYVIKTIGSDLEYIENAKTENVPWSLVKPFQMLTGTVVPGITIMLIPQWKYNYGIMPADLYQVYYDMVTELQDYVSSTTLEEVFSGLGRPFHLITFPFLERKNILLHCLLGHELGHLISKQFIIDRKGAFLRNVREEIVKNVLTNNPDEPLFTQARTSKELERAARAWERGLEEIMSDIFCAMMFGPSMLFSAFEFAIQDGMDYVPNEVNGFYPPWRLRLRQIADVIQDSDNPFFPLVDNLFKPVVQEKVNKYFDVIEGVTSSTEDDKSMAHDNTVRISYREIMNNVKDAKSYLAKALSDSSLMLKPNSLYKKLSELIDRLNNGIPPNAFELSINEREPANIVEIINATWFHKISWEEPIFSKTGEFNETICDIRGAMNSLTLKAIEYSYLESKYREECGKPPKYEE